MRNAPIRDRRVVPRAMIQAGSSQGW